MVIEPVHYGSSSILKVRFLGHPVVGQLATCTTLTVIATVIDSDLTWFSSTQNLVNTTDLQKFKHRVFHAFS